MVGGLEAQHQQRVLAVAAGRERRFGGVDQTAVGGVQPGLGDRAHRLRAGFECGEPHAGRAAVGGSCTRTQARVITPSVPSEPISIRSGDTPAPEPGSRRDSHAPRGVSARTDSTRSSMCVYSVAK